jgi:hypothetical protein
MGSLLFSRSFIMSTVIDDIVDKLDDLGYSPEFVDSLSTELAKFNDVDSVSTLPPSIAELLSKSCAEISTLLDLSATVGIRPIDAESPELLSQLRAFLAALQCPFASSHAMPSWFVLCVDWILCELLSARMLIHSKRSASSTSGNDVMEVDSTEDTGDSTLASDRVHHICAVLNLPLPTSKSTAGVDAMTNAASTISTLSTSLPANYLESPILRVGELNTRQMIKLTDINSIFARDYTVRKQMLLQRLSVTVDALMSTKRIQDDRAEIHASAAARVAALPREVKFATKSVYLVTPAILQATTARDSVQTTGPRAVRRVMIGKVPDRGGRVDSGGRVQDRAAVFQDRSGFARPATAASAGFKDKSNKQTSTPTSDSSTHPGKNRHAPPSQNSSKAASQPATASSDFGRQGQQQRQPPKQSQPSQQPAPSQSQQQQQQSAERSPLLQGANKKQKRPQTAQSNQ